MNKLNEKSEIFLTDGRSFAVLQAAEKLAEQFSKEKTGVSMFSSIPTVDGRNVYLNPEYIVSITDYSSPKEDFSYFKKTTPEEISDHEQEEKETYNQKTAQKFKKEIDNME